jgi:ribulose-phosphate 3-epimerase
MPIIIPTIFVFDHLALEDKLERYEGLMDRVQLDIADVNFAAQPTLDVDTMIEKPTSLKRDVHLMVAEPVEWLERCHEEAVDMVIGQIENMSSQAEFKKLAQDLGIKWGLAIDIDTRVEDLDWDVAKDADQILVMTVRAGKEGQKLDPKALDKVKDIRTKGFSKEICVDGGVNPKTVEACVKAGADVLAVGSSLGSAEDPAKVYQQLKTLAEKYAL